jgi:hypothetical protein
MVLSCTDRDSGEAATAAFLSNSSAVSSKLNPNKYADAGEHPHRRRRRCDWEGYASGMLGLAENTHFVQFKRYPTWYNSVYSRNYHWL